MKILILKGLPEAHLYSQFANALQAGFREAGHHCEVWERPFYGLGAEALAPLLPELGECLIRGGYEAVVSFGALLGDVAFTDGTSMYDAIGVKFLGWMFDHPIYSPGLMSPALKGRYTLHSNPQHQRFAEAIGIPGRAAVLLPGGALPEQASRPHAERRWAMVVAAAFRGTPSTRPWAHWPASPQKRLADQVTDRLLASREASLIDACRDVAAAEGLSLEDLRALDPGFDVLRETLIHIRDLDRFTTVRALVEAGTPLLVCGAGWRDALGDSRNATFIDSVPFTEIPALYADARACVNLNAGNGACERAVQASLAGTAVLSDYSGALDELLGAGLGVQFFQRGDPERLIQAAAELLSGDRTEVMGGEAQARVLRSGLWRHRAEQAAFLLDIS